MKKPKTVEGWLKTLPEPLRSSALKQGKHLRSKRSTLSESVQTFNIWADTREGFEFWNSFWHALIWAESKEG